MIVINPDGSVLLSGKVAKPLVAVIRSINNEIDGYVDDWECALGELIDENKVTHDLGKKSAHQFVWRGIKFPQTKR